MEIEVEGITYESINIEEFTCQGCIADDNPYLCDSIADSYGYCIGKDGSNIIWIEKEPK